MKVKLDYFLIKDLRQKILASENGKFAVQARCGGKNYDAEEIGNSQSSFWTGKMPNVAISQALYIPYSTVWLNSTYCFGDLLIKNPILENYSLEMLQMCGKLYIVPNLDNDGSYMDFSNYMKYWSSLLCQCILKIPNCNIPLNNNSHVNNQIPLAVN